MAYGTVVRMLVTIKCGAIALEKLAPPLLSVRYKVEVKTAGKAENTPPKTGPPT
jgi:hypothetical protein